MHPWASKQKAFTIVELLIVIVVIAILAAITIIAYTGIQDRAKQAALQSAASQASKQILAYAALNTDLYPPDEATFFSSTNLQDTSDIDYTYLTSPDRTHYCISATNPNKPTLSTAVSDTSSGTVEGRCVRNYAMNPDTEISNSGWGSRKGAAISRTSAQARTGSYSMSVVTPGAASDEGINMNSTYGSASGGVATTYMGSVWVKAPAGAALHVMTEEYNGSGSYVSGATSYFTATGAWQRVSVAKSIVSASSNAVVNVRTDNPVAVTYYIDDAMITQGSTLYEYGNGNSSGWSWDGTPSASTSFGPAKLQ